MTLTQQSDGILNKGLIQFLFWHENDALWDTHQHALLVFYYLTHNTDDSKEPQPPPNDEKDFLIEQING